MTGYIYALHLDGEPFRYVGMTNQQPHIRLAQHRRRSAKTAHLPVKRWIDMVGPFNVRLTILEKVAPGVDVSQRERHWIAEFQRQGIELLNRTLGGIVPNAPGRLVDAVFSRPIGMRFYTGEPSERPKRRVYTGSVCADGCTCGRHKVSAATGAKISAAKKAAFAARKAERAAKVDGTG